MDIIEKNQKINYGYISIKNIKPNQKSFTKILTQLLLKQKCRGFKVEGREFKVKRVKIEEQTFTKNNKI